MPSKLVHFFSLSVVLTSKILIRAVAKIPPFQRLDLNGNALCSRAIEEITNVMIQNSKILGDFDDNDEEGEDDLSEIEDESEEDEDKEADALADALKDAKI